MVIRDNCKIIFRSPQVPVNGSDGSVPDGLRPYLHHGIDLEIQSRHGVGDCPLCQSEGKFSVDCESGLWRCWVCGGGTDSGGGNPLTFIRLLHERAMELTTQEFYDEVARDRRLLSGDSVKAWGICQLSSSQHNWLVPGYGVDGRLDQLYRRTRIQKSSGEWEWALLPTPGVWPEGKQHALHMNPNNYDPTRPMIIPCEGVWDGVTLSEVVKDEFGDCNIVAVPGCNVWRDEWTALCRGKAVVLPFDSDHPRRHGLRVSRAGYDGVVRVAKRLSGSATSVAWLKWGPEGHDPLRPDGWDLRDALSGSPGAPYTMPERRDALANLLTKVCHASPDWFSPSTPHVGNGSVTRVVESRPCSTWQECEGAWKDAVRWRVCLSQTMSVLLAVCASTQQSGNQLFFQCVGSAGSLKTTMCEGLLVSQHCHNLEHLTGFHSGWISQDGKDCSLIARINGKTLVTPEADVMMSSPNFHAIMSQQRRIFDGKSGATYKNSAQDTTYVGLRTPWIMAGTPALLDTDQSRLGDRFQRIIIDNPEDDERRAIMRSAVRSERSAMVETANGTAGGIVDPRTRKAHALTGGYVDWLRANVEAKLLLIESNIPEQVEDVCMDLAELSADLRARPNEDKKKREVHDSKELPTRLARQNIRLAAHLAVVMNKDRIDAEVLKIVRKVALDTAHGHSLSIATWLCSASHRYPDKSNQDCGGLPQVTLGQWCSDADSNMREDRLSNYLMFLRKMKVLELRRPAHGGPTWLLSDRVHELYLRVATGLVDD